MPRIGSGGAPLDPIQNPYAPGAGTLPPALVGRDRELERFDFLIGRLGRGGSEKSLVLHGLRGVGKTVLLTEFASRAERAGWSALRHEWRRESDFRTAIARLVGAAIAAHERPGRVRRALRRARGALGSFTTAISTEGQVSVGFQWEPERGLADSGELEQDLGELLAELGALAAESDSGVVLLFDELQLLGLEELEGLVAALHRLAQERLPVAMVAAGLPTLPGLLLEAKTYAERLFGFPALGALAPEASERALREPAAELGVSFSDEAIAAIMAESGGYPYFLQEWGKAAWNAARGGAIDREAVAVAEAVVAEELDEEFFGLRMERASGAELALCVALAGVGEGPQPIREVAAAMGREPKALSPARAGLIRKGLVYPAGRGEVAFTVPHFGRYLRRRVPGGAEHR
ncbi:MAG: AAA family ATPase [Solirubrobacterales bacterium]|nr:AAA family ATPase [Solirubrobacterales bacterium]